MIDTLMAACGLFIVLLLGADMLWQARGGEPGSAWLRRHWARWRRQRSARGALVRAREQGRDRVHSRLPVEVQWEGKVARPDFRRHLH